MLKVKDTFSTQQRRPVALMMGVSEGPGVGHACVTS